MKKNTSMTHAFRSLSHDEQRKLLDERLTHKTRLEPQVDENLVQRPNSTKDLVERPNSTKDLVSQLRCYADDLHSAGGFNGYASAMSLAADEIVKLQVEGLPEEVCEAYGWLFHETSSERANKARRLLLTCMTKAQQKVGIQMAKERGAVVRRMSTTRGE